MLKSKIFWLAIVTAFFAGDTQAVLRCRFGYKKVIDELEGENQSLQVKVNVLTDIVEEIANDDPGQIPLVEARVSEAMKFIDLMDRF